MVRLCPYPFTVTYQSPEIVSLNYCKNDLY